MKAKYARLVQKEYLKKEIEQNPEIANVRRRILVLMIVWIVSRAAATVLEFVGAMQDMWEFQPTNITGIAIMAVFAAGVYAGERLAGILPIIGGALMLLQCLVYGHLYMIFSNEFYAVARIYAALFLLTSLIQVGVFTYVTLSKRIAVLFEAYKRSVAAAQREYANSHLDKL